MILKKDERDILFFDMYTQPSSKGRKAGVSAHPFINYIKILEELVENKSTVVVGGRNKDKVLYISDMINYEKEEILVLLLNISDRATADPVITDPEKNKRRDIYKDDGEGSDYSAHIVISYKENEESAKKYLCVIEKVPNLSVSRIEVLLNRVLRKGKLHAPSMYQSNHPDGTIVDGKIKQVKYSPEVRLSGHLSQSFAEQIESGRIERIELYRDVEVTPFDFNSILIEDRYTMSLKINRKIKAMNIDAIIAALKSGKKSYDTLRVRIKKNNGRSLTHCLDIDDEEAIHTLLVRKEKIEGFNTTLKTSSERINNDIVSKIIHEMGLHRD